MWVLKPPYHYTVENDPFWPPFQPANLKLLLLSIFQLVFDLTILPIFHCVCLSTQQERNKHRDRSACYAMAAQSYSFEREVPKLQPQYFFILWRTYKCHGMPAFTNPLSCNTKLQRPLSKMHSDISPIFIEAPNLNHHKKVINSVFKRYSSNCCWLAFFVIANKCLFRPCKLGWVVMPN